MSGMLILGVCLVAVVFLTVATAGVTVGLV